MLIKRVWGALVLCLGLAGCGNGDDRRLDACRGCACRCGDGRTITLTSDPPPCDCAQTCTAYCGGTPTVASCDLEIEVTACL